MCVNPGVKTRRKKESYPGNEIFRTVACHLWFYQQEQKTRLRCMSHCCKEWLSTFTRHVIPWKLVDDARRVCWCCGSILTYWRKNCEKSFRMQLLYATPYISPIKSWWWISFFSFTFVWYMTHPILWSIVCFRSSSQINCIFYLFSQRNLSRFFWVRNTFGCISHFQRYSIYPQHKKLFRIFFSFFVYGLTTLWILTIGVIL